MKKSKLLVLSLLAVSAMSLASCGEAGPQGEKGDTGAPGEKGEAGAPGKDGVDGTNGKNVLNGESAPKDTEGVDGDSYIDYSSFDYYVKENGKWVKKGNIKGAKGDDGEQGPKGDTGSKGEKGDTGSTGGTGSRGPQGETAWSNTILPNKYGYITADKGSATTQENVTFKVVITDTTSIAAFSLLLDGKAVKAENIYRTATNDKSTTFEYTVQMQKYGYVVSADFYSTVQEAASKATEISLVKDIKSDSGLLASSSSFKNIGGISSYNNLERYDGGTDPQAITVGGAFNLNLNGFSIDLGNNTIKVTSGASFNVINKDKVEKEEGETSSAPKISGSTTGSLIEVDGSSLSLGSNVSIEASAGTAIKQSGSSSSVAIGESSSVTGEKNGIEISGGSLNISGNVASSAASFGKDDNSGSVSGAAIAVIQESATTELKVEVSATGSVEAGKNALAVYQESAKPEKGETASTVVIKVDEKSTIEGEKQTDVKIDGDKEDSGGSGDAGDKEDDKKGSIVFKDECGYVTKIQGSGIEVVTYCVYPNKGYSFLKLSFGDGDGVVTESSEDRSVYKYTYSHNDTSPLGAVKATFIKDEDIGNNVVVDQVTGEKYTNLVTAIPETGSGNLRLLQEFDAAKDYEGDYFAITNKNILIDLNGFNMTSSRQFNLGEGLERFVVTGYGNIVSDMPTDEKSSKEYALNIATGAYSVEVEKDGKKETENKAPYIEIGRNVTLKTTRKNCIGVSNGSHVLTTGSDGKLTPSETHNAVWAKVYIYGNVELTGENSESAIKVEGNQKTSSDIKVYVSGNVTSEKGKAIEIHAGELEVSGGNITGVDGVYVSKEASASDKIKVTLKGGTIKSTGTETEHYAVYFEDGITPDEYTIQSGVTIEGKVKLPKGVVSNETELKTALEDSTCTSIIFANDIALSDSLSINKALTINLGDYKLTAKSIKTSNETGTLTFKGNGTAKDNIVLTDGMEVNSAIKLENVKLTSTKGITCKGKFSFTATDSLIEISGSEGISVTDEVAALGGAITLKNTTLKVTGKDSYGVMLATQNTNDSPKNNRPSLTVTNSTIQAEAQGVIVRTGTATFNGATIDLKLSNISGDGMKVSDEWGTENKVPFGALIVGDNKANQYKNDNATVNINSSGLNILYPTGKKDFGRGLIIMSNDSDDKTVTLICKNQSTNHYLKFNYTPWNTEDYNKTTMNSINMQGKCSITLSSKDTSKNITNN